MLSLPSGSALYRVFGPGLAVRGFFSGRERSLLGPGEFQLLQNMRCDEGLPRVRRGLSFLLAPPSFAVGPPLGATSCSLNGTRWVVAVWSDGTQGRVCVAPPSLDRWVEVTSTNAWTGPLGNNRLTNITNPLSFTVVKTPRYDAGGGSIFASRDVLLMQNGEDYPRMFDPDTEHAASPLTISAATNASPIVLTTTPHNLSSGDHVHIYGATGMPEINGVWQITWVAPNKFSLVGSAGVLGHSYTGGGIAEDRIDLLVHKPISVPSVIGSSYATYAGYLQIAGTSGKTYASGTGVNQSGHFEFKQTNATPYIDESTCIIWNIGTGSAINDRAHVQFSSAISLGRQLVMLWEGLGISSMLTQVKIEINPNNIAYSGTMPGWVTIYDPAGGVEQIKRNPIFIQENLANGRTWIIFDVGFTSRTPVFHLQFTRQSAATQSSPLSAILLFCGTGEGDLAANTTFAFTYEDKANRVESALALMNSFSDPISFLGGPTKVKDGSSTSSSPSLPLDSNFLTAFRKTFINTDDGAIISGGLNGIPQSINTYLRPEGSTNYYYTSSFTLFDHGYSTSRAWNNSNYTKPMLSPDPITYSQALINYNREAPSEFQQPIPIASTAAYANGRLFVGGVKDNDGQYGNGDVYFSWQRNPFRFQQIQEDDFRGGYLQVSGEKVQAFVSGASSSLNAGKIYLLTDQSIYSLGDSGPLAGGSFSASDISRPVKIAPHGTISARSVSQGYNSVFWVDQDSQLMRLANGEIVNIGKYQVHDKLEAVPSNLTKNLAGVFKNDRYYLGLGKTSSNENVLLWNERLQGFESLDVPSKSFELPFLHGPSGTSTGTRIFFFHTDGKMYAYEENNTDDAGTPIIARFTTGSIVSSEWEGFFINECQAMVTSSPGGSLNVNRVSRKWGATEPWTTTLNVDKSGAAVAIYRDSFAHTKVGANRGLETDWDWYLDVSGSLPPNSQFIRFECALQPTSVALGER